MSIRPSVIDRNVERPCMPGMYFVAKRIAEGRAPSTMQRIRRALANLLRRLGQ